MLGHNITFFHRLPQSRVLFSDRRGFPIPIRRVHTCIYINETGVFSPSNTIYIYMTEALIAFREGTFTGKFENGQKKRSGDEEHGHGGHRRQSEP